MDAWLEEAKKDPSAQTCGMYLVHRPGFGKGRCKGSDPGRRKRKNGCGSIIELFL